MQPWKQTLKNTKVDSDWVSETTELLEKEYEATISRLEANELELEEKQLKSDQIIEKLK